jgi:integrase
MMTQDMTQRYRKFKRTWGMNYAFDNLTGNSVSLKTRVRAEAEQKVNAMNETERQPGISLGLARVYLNATDPKLATRTWQEVMEHIVEKKTDETRRRWDVAIKDKNFSRIRNLKVAETRAEHFDRALADGKVSTNVYLRRIHNHALGMDWLPVPVLPKKKFPKVKHKEARAIKWEEHCRIVARERNAERRDFYELCWYLGGSQSDIAHLHAEDLDYERRSFAYDRKKTGRMGGMRIGSNAWETILRRPRMCPLFPYLITVREANRATEFKQRCEGLGINGVTLHSYRYAWAERSADNGYPERYAQRALGQNSKMVHRAYAKKAQGELPSLEEYEDANRKAKENGKILVLQHETEVPKVA